MLGLLTVVSLTSMILAFIFGGFWADVALISVLGFAYCLVNNATNILKISDDKTFEIQDVKKKRLHTLPWMHAIFSDKDEP